MTERVEIVIAGRDEASGVFQGVRGALGGILQTAAGMLSARIFENIAGGIVDLGKTIWSEATEAQEIQAQLSAVLKSTGEAAGITAEMADDLATSLSGVTRFSDDAILGGENLLLTFTSIGKDVFPAATETMLNMSQALGQDLQSSAVQLGKALQDPIQGVTALRRVGVNFTDAQKDQIKAMVEAGDVMGAQKLILKELQTEFGGSARAAGETFTGQLDILKNSLLNVAEEAGTNLIPILTEGLQSITPYIVEFCKWMGENIPVAVKWAREEVGPFIASMVKWFRDDALPVIIQFSDWWTNTARPAIQAFVDWAGPIFDALFKGISAIFENFQLIFEGRWGELGERVRKQLGDLLNWFITLDWGAIGTAIVEGIGAGITAGVDWILKALESVSQAAIDFIKGFLGISSPSRVFRGIGANLMSGMALGIQGGAQMPVAAVQGAAMMTLNQANSYMMGGDLVGELRGIRGAISNQRGGASAAEIGTAVRDAVMMVLG